MANHKSVLPYPYYIRESAPLYLFTSDLQTLSSTYSKLDLSMGVLILTYNGPLPKETYEVRQSYPSNIR